VCTPYYLSPAKRIGEEMKGGRGGRGPGRERGRARGGRKANGIGRAGAAKAAMLAASSSPPYTYALAPLRIRRLPIFILAVFSAPLASLPRSSTRFPLFCLQRGKATALCQRSLHTPLPSPPSTPLPFLSTCLFPRPQPRSFPLTSTFPRLRRTPVYALRFIHTRRYRSTCPPPPPPPPLAHLPPAFPSSRPIAHALSGV
jgi:hypothetical protein